MFSVIIPLYNKELSVANTINSVLNQSYQNFEIIIVNDGSTDNSRKIVSNIDDSRILIIDKTNGGVSSARNLGIQRAKYEWISFLDADDLWSSTHLETVFNMISKYPKEVVFATSFKFSNGLKERTSYLKTDFQLIKNYFLLAENYPVLWTSIVTINKIVLDKVGGFNESLSRGEDLDLWTRIVRKYDIVKSNIITAIYRIDAENRSDSSGFNLLKSRVFNYNFENATTKEEYNYYKHYISITLLHLLRQKEYHQFFLLKNKHSNISYIDIFISLLKKLF